MENDGFNRIIKAYKLCHPNLKKTLLNFIEKTVELAFDLVDIPKLVALTISDITTIQEIAMKVFFRIYYYQGVWNMKIIEK